MSRDHAALQLLRLGPLEAREFVAITGWPRSSANLVLSRLLEKRRIRRAEKGYYEVREAA